MKRFLSLFIIFSFALILVNTNTFAKPKFSKTSNKGTIQVLNTHQTANTNNNQTNIKAKGTWLWNAYLIINKKYELINYLKSNNFSEVYLCIDASIDYKYYKEFISLANLSNIKVQALLDDRLWYTENNSLEKNINWVNSYNLSNNNERFSGVHLDIEPYVLNEWTSNKERLILLYKDYILKAKKLANSIGLKLAIDIPFWFDEVFHNNQSLAQWVFENVDKINIMAYRDKAQDIISIVSNEINLSKNYNKELVISVETGNTPEGNYVTFYQEGSSYMYEELNKVQNYYLNSGANFSFAVHYLDNLINWDK